MALCITGNCHDVSNYTTQKEALYAHTHTHIHTHAHTETYTLRKHRSEQVLQYCYDHEVLVALLE